MKVSVAYCSLKSFNSTYEYSYASIAVPPKGYHWKYSLQAIKRKGEEATIIRFRRVRSHPDGVLYLRKPEGLAAVNA